MKAIEKAVGYLNIKPRTEKEVRTYLHTKGYSEEDIEEAILELREYRFIDDFQYALMYIEMSVDKGRGLRRIEHQLRQKGVHRDTIQRAIQECQEIPDQQDMATGLAIDIAQDILRCERPDQATDFSDYTMRQKFKAKIVRRLVGRGFSPEQAYKAAAMAIDEVTGEDEPV